MNKVLILLCQLQQITNKYFQCNHLLMLGMPIQLAQVAKQSPFFATLAHADEIERFSEVQWTFEWHVHDL
jgi:hypothetical protein